jgi:integrase
MHHYNWKSKLSHHIINFITLMRSNGYIYEAEEYELYRFDKLCFNNPDLDTGFLNREIVSLWRIQLPNENTNTRNYRVSHLRQFSYYLQSLGLDTYIPIFAGSSIKPIVYVPTHEELKIFLQFIDNYRPHSSAKYLQRLNIMYPIIFRLLYCCGLRLSEGCNINRDNINLNQGVLTILQSKGLKDREIFIASDLCEICKKYDYKMNELIPNREWFFPGWNYEKPIPKTTIDLKFHNFWDKSFPNWTSKYPTPHSLRHAFTVRRMTLWMKEGKDLNVMMPFLSKYLGHVGPQETFYYYHHLESIYPIIKEKDKHSSNIIPEVEPYEN